MVGNGNKLNEEMVCNKSHIDKCYFFASVTHKVTAGAKSFGSFFTGVVNKAGAKIKETVKDNVSIAISVLNRVITNLVASVNSRRIQQRTGSIYQGSVRQGRRCWSMPMGRPPE